MGDSSHSSRQTFGLDVGFEVEVDVKVDFEFDFIQISVVVEVEVCWMTF